MTFVKKLDGFVIARIKYIQMDPLSVIAVCRELLEINERFLSIRQYSDEKEPFFLMIEIESLKWIIAYQERRLALQ